MIGLLCGAALMLLALLDAARRLDLTRWWLLGPLLLAGPHVTAWGVLIFSSREALPLKVLAALLTFGGLFYAYVRVMLFPVRRYDCENPRIKILWSGRAVLRAGM